MQISIEKGPGVNEHEEASPRPELLHERIARIGDRGEAKRPGKATRSNTRNMLLAAALELFARKGFEATTMRDLAKAVGIKVPGIYSHFESKQQVLQEAMSWMMEDFLDFTLTPDDPDVEAIERLRLILRRQVLHAFENPVLARGYDFISSAILLERIGDETAQAMLKSALDRYEGAVLELVRKILNAADKYRVDAIAATNAIITMHDQMVRRYVPAGDLQKEEFIETYWKFARSILLYQS